MKPLLSLLIVLLLVSIGRAAEKAADPLWAGSWGFPEGTVRQNGAIYFAYDATARNPRWVLEMHTAADFNGAAERSNRFYADETIPRAWRATNPDYAGANRDRGHMACAGNFPRQSDQDKSFCLSNMCPQDPDLNRYFWKHLEWQVRQMGDPGLEIWIITGPIYPAPIRGQVTIRTIGSGVWDPERFFKAVLVCRGATPLGMRCWIVPNKPVAHDANEADYRYSVAAAQDEIHLDLFSGLPDDVEAAMEGKP